jgi:hypothetical protein
VKEKKIKQNKNRHNTNVLKTKSKLDKKLKKEEIKNMLSQP